MHAAAPPLSSDLQSLLSRKLNRMAQLLAVAGSLNADLVFSLQRVPRAGETLAARGMTTMPGGKVRDVRRGRMAPTAAAAAAATRSLRRRRLSIAPLRPPPIPRVATRQQRRPVWDAPPSWWRKWGATRRRACALLRAVQAGSSASVAPPPCPFAALFSGLRTALAGCGATAGALWATQIGPPTLSSALPAPLPLHCSPQAARGVGGVRRGHGACEGCGGRHRHSGDSAGRGWWVQRKGASAAQHRAAGVPAWDACCTGGCTRVLEARQLTPFKPSVPPAPLPSGDNRIVIHGGANTAPWSLGGQERAALTSAGAVLLQREIPEAVNLELAQVGAAACRC